MKHYDYVLVGSGLYAGVFAWYARKNKKTCLVLDVYKRQVEDMLIQMVKEKYSTTTQMAEALGVDQSTISRKLRNKD